MQRLHKLLVQATALSSPSAYKRQFQPGRPPSHETLCIDCQIIAPELFVVSKWKKARLMLWFTHLAQPGVSLQ